MLQTPYKNPPLFKVALLGDAAAVDSFRKNFDLYGIVRCDSRQNSFFAFNVSFTFEPMAAQNASYKLIILKNAVIPQDQNFTLIKQQVKAMPSNSVFVINFSDAASPDKLADDIQQFFQRNLKILTISSILPLDTIVRQNIRKRFVSELAKNHSYPLLLKSELDQCENINNQALGITDLILEYLKDNDIEDQVFQGNYLGSIK